MSEHYQVIGDDDILQIRNWLGLAGSALPTYYYKENRYIEFRPSHITSCPLAQLIHAAGYSPGSNQQWEYAALVGRSIHEHMLSSLLSLQSLDLLGENVDNIEIEKKVYSADLPMSGSIDLLVTVGDKRYIGELKTYGGRIYREVKKPWYFQTQAYMMMTGAEYAIIWQASRAYGLVSATNFKIEPEQIAFDYIANHIDYMSQLIEDDKVDQCVRQEDCSSCQYKLLCSDKKIMNHVCQRLQEMDFLARNEENSSR